jgi:hypothetical protein
MQIVEVFLPLDKGSGARLDAEVIDGIVAGLADRFGGATAFTRSPAEGLWKQQQEVQRDRIVIVEVIVDDVDEAWWKDYRARLEEQLEQEEVLIRATPCRRL